jgi:beta-glucosidase
MQPFPPNFLFGAATSAYQIEGCTQADGRGPSWWDRFAHTPGRIVDGSTGDSACDHYRRWREDLALMARFDLNAYRFSIAWPRVLPNGRGKLNPAGLDFYERLVDALLAHGITPFATLYHWDLPLPLADEGGWLQRGTAEAFADYAALVVQRLGDRVQRWATINEPRCAAFVGHLEGRHAPGLQSMQAALTAGHHLLLGHGLAVRAMRALRADVQASIVLDLKPHMPATAAPEDAAAALRGDGVFNRWFLDAVFLGRYPSDTVQGFDTALPSISANDMAVISTPVDALGINYYTRALVRHDATRPYPQLREQQQAGAHQSTMGWEDYPEGLYNVLTRVAQEYAPREIYVAENGAAEPDVPDADGAVHDPARVRYLQGHWQAASRALAQGVPLSAYLVWSLLDNFEWGRGYTQRFGLVHVDYSSQRRTPKDSMHAYSALIKTCRKC